MTTSKARTTPRVAALPPRRNLSADERADEILRTAVEFFAEHGFNASLQDLATRIGVTQPLLHRYFPTKADLIARCKEELMRGHHRACWPDWLADRRRPLGVRLYEFYLDYLPRIYRPLWFRGFLFAAIDDPAFARTYVEGIQHDLLDAVLREARHEYGYPPVEALAAHPREVELVMGMHSTFVFLGQRVFVYGMPMPPDLNAVVRDQTQAYLAAAQVLMQELMRCEAEPPEAQASAQGDDAPRAEHGTKPPPRPVGQSPR